MGISAGPNIVRDGSLVLGLDASDANSFNKNEGRVWTDLSGNNTSGSIINGPSLNNDSYGSFNFNGINSYISIANNPILEPPTSLTLECALRIDSIISGRVIVAYSGDAGGSYIKYGFRISGTSLSGYINSNGSIAQIFGNVLTANTWVYATLTYDGTSAKIYENGFFSSSTPITGSMDYTAYGSPYYLNIGRKANDGGYISGSIGLVKLYNRALSAAEIQSNYNQFKTRFNRTTPNIVTYTSLNTTTAIESFNDVLEFTNILVGSTSFGAANAVALVNETP
jgi:hypothetical protein